MTNKILLGSHIGMCAPDYLLASVNKAISYGCNCFMIYTGAPQNSKRTDLNLLKINEYLKILKLNDVDSENVIVHGPYIINIATSDQKKSLISKSLLIKEIERTFAIKSKYLVVHPGFCTNVSREQGIINIANVINNINQTNKNIVICLETMSGKGTEIGRNFEELKQIIDLIDNKSLIGVCLDTCHVNDSGLDVTKVDDVINLFDEIIGLKYLKVIHLNDSINSLGSHKDRHQNIGYGQIGFNALHSWVIHPKLINIPKILETPWCGNKPIYKQEIQMLKSGKWFDIKKEINNIK